MKNIIVVVIMAIFLLSSCGGRLSSKLYEIKSETTQLLSNKSSYYLQGFYFFDNKDNNDPIKPGNGNVLVASMITPEQGKEIVKTGLLTAVGEIEYRIFIDLPDQIKADSLDIRGQSICRIIGLYELDESLRRYYCSEGFLLIDTLKSSRFHAQMFGKYFNNNNDSLVFKGGLSVKRKN